MVSHALICAEQGVFLGNVKGVHWDTIFADPPDNVGATYHADYTEDNLPKSIYLYAIDGFLRRALEVAGTIWLSYNAKWIFDVGKIVTAILEDQPHIQARQCVQTFTFGQHNQHDLCNGYRPLLRLRHPDAYLYPDRVRVKSWRQENGDKRADPRGRVPSDVFDFPRVTGNSKQRRSWHPTQLNELLVERCLRLTTPSGGSVLDPYAGTGTTLRVCRKLGFSCWLIERSGDYCARIADEHDMNVVRSLASFVRGDWRLEE